jgi:hypothetical protein
LLFSLLLAAVRAQDPHGVPVQGDGAAARRGFRWSDRNGVAVGDALLPDHDHLGVQVDVDPSQAGGLTAAEAAQCDEPPHRGQPVARDEVQEPCHLSARPDRDRESFTGAPPVLDAVVGPHLRLRPAGRGDLDVPGRVVP